MGEPNWGLIRSGECFEALVHALVFADDHKARLMDRPGKDKGVDALSGDGETVYQAKFYSNLTMDEVISIARNEMVKIKGHLSGGDATWLKVRNWVLFINVSQNTWDVEKWDAFCAEFKTNTGIDAYCNGLANISQHLTTHPEIGRVFFNGHNRCLLYAKETYLKLERHSYKSSFYKAKFIGRDAELGRLIEVLNASDKRLIVIAGPSEVGRTRFMFEAMMTLACRGKRTYWGQIDSMENSSRWFDGIPLGEDAVIFVDDCDSERRLKLILDQMYGAGMEGIKYVMSAADGSMSCINHILRRINYVEVIRLSPFSSEVLAELVNGYEGVSLRPDMTGAICNFASGYPGWAVLCIASQVYCDANVMIMAQDVVSRLMSGVADRLKEPAKVFLRWLALWGEVDFSGYNVREIVDFLSSHGINREMIDDLKKELAEKGLIRRITIDGDLCRVVSKIVRHQILLEWLIDYANDRHVQMTSQGEELLGSLIQGHVPRVSNVLASLSSISIAHLPGTHTDTFIGPVLDSIKAWLQSSNPLSSLDEDCALSIVENVGCSDPNRALAICRFVWDNGGIDSPVNDTVYGRFVIEHNRVCTRIPAVLFSVAEYLEDKTQAKDIAEFLLTIWREGEGRSIKYDRQESAEYIMSRLVTSSRPYNPFPHAIFTYLSENKDRILASKELMTMAEWLFTVRLSRTFFPISRKVVLERAYVTSGTEMWHYREKLREWLFDVINSTNDILNRCHCWRLIEREHAMLTAAISDLDRRKLSKEDVVSFNEILLNDLQRVQSFVTTHDADITDEEFPAIRKIWEVHLLSNNSCANEDVKAVAMSCEAVYRSKMTYNFQDIYCSDYGSEQSLAAIKEAVSQFLNPPDGEFYKKFFQGASRFLKSSQGNDENDFGRTEDIVIGMFESHSFDYTLGNGTSLDVYVRTVYADFLGCGELDRKFVVALTRFMFKNAKSNDGDATLYKKLWDKICTIVGNAEAMKSLVGRVFDRCNPKATGDLCEWELERLLELGLADSDKANIIPAYYNYGAERVLREMQRMLEGVRDNNETSRRLWEIALFRLYVASLQNVLTVDERLLGWIFDMMMERKVDERTWYSHHFETLMTQANYKYPIKKLQDLLESGVTLERDFDVQDFFVVNGDEHTFMTLCGWVLEDGKDVFMRKYTLPLYLVKLDADLSLVKRFVLEKAHECQSDVGKLKRLARFAGCLDNTSEGWRELARVVCDAAVSVSEKDRVAIYSGLNPLFYTWGGFAGEISPDIINRMERAKESLRREPLDSSLRGYWSLELSLATAEFKREEAEIARESDD